MEGFEFDREQIEEIFRRAETSLFSAQNIKWLKYDVSFLCQNSTEIIGLVKNTAIVYCIWMSDGLSPTPIYVGHSSSLYARQRLINHLVRKHKKTGAQLEKVEKAVKDGNEIGVSFLKIEPDYMRKPLEEWLISRNRNKLVWNIHGKGKLI